MFAYLTFKHSPHERDSWFTDSAVESSFTKKKKKTVKYTQEVSLVAFGIPFFAHLADGFFGIWLFNAYTHKMRIDSENPVFEACFLCPFFLIKNWRRAVVHFGWWILSFDRETSSPVSQGNSLIHCDSYFTSLAVYLRETDFFFFQ